MPTFGTYDTITVDRRDGIVWITLDNAETQNRINVPLLDDLGAVGHAVADASDVRGVVLTHEGDFFGAGGDLSHFADDGSNATYIRESVTQFNDVVRQYHRLRVPVVGGIDGVAVGGSFALAIVPDIVLVSDAASFEFVYPRIGLTGDGGITYLLPHLVGLRAATEIALLDEPIDAERAVELGLATERVSTSEFGDRLSEIASELAAGPTAALGATKRLLAESVEHSFDDHLTAEKEAMVAATQTGDYERGIAAFRAGEEPDFRGQ